MNIVLVESPNVTILASSIKIQCNTCKTIWGVYINLTEGTQPKDWDKCHNCEKLGYKSKKEKVKNNGWTNELSLD